jgi:hypothetical protein
MIYNLTVHYYNDPDDALGYDDEIEAENIKAAIKHVEQLDDYKDIYYYVLESEDGEEYYNTSELEGFEPED